MRELRRLLGYLGPYRRDLLIAAVMIILETAFEMVIPVLMADIIDVGVANRDVAVILQRGIQMGVCALLALATGLLYARFTARAAYGWGANIREAQFERVQKYAFSNLDKFETSSLVTRMTTDVTVLQNTVNGGYRPLVRSPVMLVMGVGLSFWMNPRLALVFLVCAPVLGGVLFVIVRRVAPMYGRLQKAVDRLNNVVQEGLTAIRAVKAFVRGEYEEEKFQGVNSELMETSQRTFRLAVLNLPVFQLVMYTAVVLIMWLGGNMVFNSGLQVGQLTGFLSYVLQVMNSMMLISNVFLLLTRSLASARRISEVLDENIVLDSPEDAVEEVPDGSVEFEGVSFKYHSGAREYALSGVELHIPAGQIQQSAAQQPKNTLITVIFQKHIHSRAEKFHKRIHEYRLLLVYKTGDIKLIEGPCRMVRIGLHISCDHCEIPASVSFLPHQAAYHKSCLFHLPGRVSALPDMDCLLFFCIDFLSEPEQIPFQKCHGLISGKPSVFFYPCLLDLTARRPRKFT